MPPGSGNYVPIHDLDTVTYRYLSFEISRYGGDGTGPKLFWDSTALSEIIIDATPEPATLVLLALGGLVAIRRRKA